MFMEIKFVDKQLSPITADEPKEKRYAVDLGKTASFAGETLPFLKKHFFISAQPWAKNMNLSETRSFLRLLKELNPKAEFGLLTERQIDALNFFGAKFGFEIENTWTSGCYTDWHGRIDGRYSIKGGKLFCDNGENITDVYVLFGFTPGQEEPIKRP